MVFNLGLSAARLECKFFVLRVGAIHFPVEEEIRVPLCPIRYSLPDLLSIRPLPIRPLGPRKCTWSPGS